MEQHLGEGAEAPKGRGGGRAWGIGATCAQRMRQRSMVSFQLLRASHQRSYDELVPAVRRGGGRGRRERVSSRLGLGR